MLLRKRRKEEVEEEKRKKKKKRRIKKKKLQEERTQGKTKAQQANPHWPFGGRRISMHRSYQNPFEEYNPEPTTVPVRFDTCEVEITTINYRYDKRGNWTRKTLLTPEGAQHVIERKLWYY